ncbi:pentatricopeptide repeat-containing protein At5g06540-like [Cucurbita pepo subsp. pepo]|uniref:pentatricopeptide repeat-containing protein At5g06540-like n=1 Tax=Cucurbita pepo subsp. pepo TaxID=3664 RepID=UPI000C9D7D0F|nr:pentatricopeptide repeat-containing protein At5g06540-like [Cucurbita pepo subsp. pepo]XP_023549651.1 pentatricopeptide repeat-containing protein At5g06540-like [Cucurbita pepo subsp. pepo]XP_023549652.1 pentatricopeptide repeat-containing protein At5g06540-like [Cucurbita pepo subsp. pepo]
MIHKSFKDAIAPLIHKSKSLQHLKEIHGHLLKTHLPESPYGVAPLLAVAATSGDNDGSFFSYACAIFKNLRHRNTFMYNSMIRGYVLSRAPKQAILCYLDLIDQGLFANNYTFPPLIKASALVYSELKRVGYLVHAHVIVLGYENDPFVVSTLVEFYSLIDLKVARVLFDKSSVKDVVVWTAMVDGYGKVGDVESARELFDEMPVRNVISWSAMIAAYSRVSDFREVLCLFRQMQEKDIKPNESITVSVLTACAHLGAITQGLWMHSYAKRHRWESNLILATALVDMYSKCGYIESALAVFEGISNKDAGAWNAMISGVAMNGDVTKSLELFDKMILNGTQATETTFVAVLAACTHAKMVDTGLKLFDQMYTVYGVQPQFEHYACVVDLMARAGMVEDAEEFIEKKMGGFSNVDANVWGAMLGACRKYGNIEVGNRIWRKLLAMGVTDCGTQVLSYNIYAEAGWEMAAKEVRKNLSETRSKKTPGCSVLEVDGAVQEFLAGDLSHPQVQDICEMLGSLSRMVKWETLGQVI